MSQTHPFTKQPLPSGWQVFTVDELRSDEKSSCVAGPFGSSISSKYFMEEGVPVIRGSNLTAGGKRFVSDLFVYVSEERAKKYAAQHVIKDDLVFTCWGSVGHVGIIPKDGPFEEYIISNKQLKLRVNKEIVSPLYTYLYFASSLGVDYVKSYAKGAAVPGISLGILKGLEVAVPPLPTQDRIVSLVSAYDDLIENNTRRIEILEEMARRLYEEWFVHFRFPGHEGVSFKKSELGRIPEGWEVKSVAETFQILGGGTPSKKVSEYWEGGEINWFSPTDLTKSSSAFMEESSSKITELGLKKSSAKLFPENSVMMTSRATIGVVAINTQTASTNQGFITCLPNDEFSLYLMYHWLKDNVETFISLGTGATFKEISKGTFKEIQIAVPPLDVSRAYQEAVGPMMQQVLLLQRKNANLRAQRDLLLPKLVSGEIDVTDISMPDDKEVEAA